METTVDQNADRPRNGEFKNLMADVQELVSRIADVKDVDVARLRSKVQGALTSATESLATGAEGLQQRARQVAGSADDYVRASPWQAIGVAALAGLAIGFLAARRS
jgi:ElaB protein